MPELSPTTHAQLDGELGLPNAIVNRQRVNVALPFSAIKIEESSDELRALARLVSDLVDAVASNGPVDKKTVKSLRTRASALVERLDS